MPLIVKICGLTNLKDAQAAVAAGADWVGFIFYPPSPRAVTPEEAGEIVSALPATVCPVGVFVQPDAATVRRTAAIAGLQRVQLHGVAPELLEELADLRPVRVVALGSEDDLPKIDELPEVPVLVDTPSPEWGGSGRTGDWGLAATAARRRPILLAGGLTPENVAEAVLAVRPAGVDVASGVEASKGRKDHDKVAAFVAAARSAMKEMAP